MPGTYGFIGVGHMGGAMAQHLLEMGDKLVIHDLNPKSVERLVKLGATAAGSNKAVADQTEVVFACLPSRVLRRCRVQSLLPPLLRP